MVNGTDVGGHVGGQRVMWLTFYSRVDIMHDVTNLLHAGGRTFEVSALLVR